MIVTYSGSTLAWTCTKSELDKMPKCASSKTPFVTINLSSGEITTRGVRPANSKVISSRLTRIATAIAAAPIADRYLRFGSLRYTTGSARLFSDREYWISRIDCDTHNRVIRLSNDISNDTIDIVIGHKGDVVKVAAFGSARALRDVIHSTYTDVISLGVAMYEDVDAVPDEDVI